MWQAWKLLVLGRILHLVMCIDCPDADFCHNTGNDKYLCSHTMAECVDRRCICTEKDYNLCTCLPNVAGCSISYKSPKAVAIPSYGGDTISQPTYSCTPRLLNPEYNVHIISNYEGNGNSEYKVHSAGLTNLYIEVTKPDYRPVVLILTSYEPVRWRLSIGPRDAVIDKVVLISHYLRQSTVLYQTEQIKSIIRYSSSVVPRGYGDDAGGGDTVGLLYYVQHNYGSVASFTGSYRADRWDMEINGTEINEIPMAFVTPISGRPRDRQFIVRLTGNTPSVYQGRVEILYKGTWGTICDENWDIYDATVVCRQLSYGQAIRATSGGEYGRGDGPVVLNNVACAGDETNLFDCPLNPWQPLGETTCEHKVGAGVVCEGDHAGPDEISQFIIRLAGSNSLHEGRVEVLFRGEWGTVCDDEWDLSDANVVCRQLGYAYADRYSVSSEFGEGTGIIVLDNMNCAGDEANLYDCPMNTKQPLGKTNCKHSEDAGVVCQRESSLSNFSLKFLIGPITFFLIVSLLCLAICCLCKVCRNALQRRRRMAAGQSVQYTNRTEYQLYVGDDPNRAPGANDLPPSYDSVVRNSAAYPHSGENTAPPPTVSPVPSTPPPSYSGPKPGETAFSFDATETANV